MNRDELTYAAHAKDVPELEVGKLVKIRVRGRLTWGIITALSRRQPQGVTKFSEIESTLPVKIPNALILLAQVMRKELWHPLGECFAAMLPPVMKRFPTMDSAATNADESKANLKEFVICSPPADRWQQYQSIISRVINSNRSVILVFSHRAYMESFIDTCSLPVIRWETDASQAARWKIWNKSRANQPQIIIGLRTAIFAPVDNLGAVIIDSPTGRGHKSDQAPYYSTLETARWRQKVGPFQLIVGDSVPPLMSTKITSIKTKAAFTPIDLITSDATAFGALQATSETWLEENGNAESHFFILLNRTGAGSYRCQTCHELVRCPNCEHIPVVSRGKLNCQVCSWSGTAPARCKNCQSTSLSLRGSGTEELVKRLSVIMDETVQLVDRNHPVYPDSNTRIIVGTEFALPYLINSPPDFSLVLGVNEMRLRPSFDASERAIRLIAEVSGVTKERVGIETKTPDDEWFLQIKRHAYAELIQQELADRKNFNYPPISVLVAFSSTNGEPLDNIKRQLTEQGINSLGPTSNPISKRSQLIAKIHRRLSPPTIFNSLEQAGLLKDITVEVNPPTEHLD